MTALDEADQMADHGLPTRGPHAARRHAELQPAPAVLATLDNDVKTLVREFLPEHELHSTQDGRASVTTMGPLRAARRPRRQGRGARRDRFPRGRPHDHVRAHQAGAEGITERLREKGVAAEALHGGKAQNQRTRVLERFKTGRTPVLVATDVAARGIHVDGIDLVVHVDPPQDHKDYLHAPAAPPARASGASSRRSCSRTSDACSSV